MPIYFACTEMKKSQCVSIFLVLMDGCIGTLFSMLFSYNMFELHKRNGIGTYRIILQESLLMNGSNEFNHFDSC